MAHKKAIKLTAEQVKELKNLCEAAKAIVMGEAIHRDGPRCLS